QPAEAAVAIAGRLGLDLLQLLEQAALLPLLRPPPSPPPPRRGDLVGILAEEVADALGHGQEAGGGALDLHHADRLLEVDAEALSDLPGGIKLQREPAHLRFLAARSILLVFGAGL